ncbi:MAG: transcriptional repressor [Pseudomonadota bacterium]
MSNADGPPKTLPCQDHHDHVARSRAVLEALERQGRGRATPTRRRVLEILLETQCALGAYDILHRLRAEGMPAQPPVAYRALDFLMRHGLVHRIERLNAYVACLHPGQGVGGQHSPAFLVCRSCHLVTEDCTGSLVDLNAVAQGAGFQVERTVIEVIGLCDACQRAEREATRQVSA